MTLFARKQTNILDLRQGRRQRYIDLNGSRWFQHDFGAIVAAANEYVEVRTTFPEARKYEPLDTLHITNNSTETFRLEVNGRQVGVVVAGTIVTLDEHPIWAVRLTNLSATDSAATEVFMLLRRSPWSTDKQARLDRG